MKTTQQEIHLWAATLRPGCEAGPGATAGAALPLPLPFAPVKLGVGAGELRPLPAGQSGREGAVVVEPFFNQRKQLRLFAAFPPGAAQQVNGEAAPPVAVLVAGDLVQWDAGPVLQVLEFNRPQLSQPPETCLGKPCMVCRVPFTAKSTCYTCACGVVLHCEADEKEGLQCAQLRRVCPACGRPIVLTAGYVNPPAYGD